MLRFNVIKKKQNKTEGIKSSQTQSAVNFTSRTGLGKKVRVIGGGMEQPTRLTR